MNSKLPALRSDEDAEALLERDLSKYITAENLAPFPFEFRPKARSINLRISEELLGEVQAAARRQGIPYQRFIRQVLETSLRHRDGS
jgi:predicted DNA binding CopG/RHH family protein